MESVLDFGCVFWVSWWEDQVVNPFSLGLIQRLPTAIMSPILWSFIPTVPCTITEGQQEWEDTMISRKRLRISLVCTQYSTNLVKQSPESGLRIFAFFEMGIVEFVYILTLFICYLCKFIV